MKKPMKNLNLPSALEDKVYQITFDDENKIVSKITTYFPLSENEKQIFVNLLGKNSVLFDGFHSIFSDQISESEWSRSKEQIKKRFQDELIDID
jgi:hypothetical protein